MGTLLRIAFANLVQAPRRSLLLGLAIAIVTGLLVILMSLSAGINANLVESATHLAAGHVNVSGFFKPTSTSAAPMITHKSEIRAVVEDAITGVDYIVERDRGWARVVSETGSIQAGLTGIVAAEEHRFLDSIELAPVGDYVEGGGDQVEGDVSKLAQPDSIMLFASQAEQLEVRVGDPLTITSTTAAGMSNTVDCTVVAVAKDLGIMSSFWVFVPRQLILDLYQLNEETTGALWIYLDDIDRAPAVMSELRQALAAAGYEIRDHDPNPFFMKFDKVMGEDWSGQQLDLTIWKDEVSFVNWILTGFDAISIFMITLLVVIIAVGIMNAMWNAVRERTKEIGTMRAIGMTRSRVLVLFLLEAALLGSLAATAGALGGSGIAALVNAAQVHIPAEAVRAILLSEILRMVVTPASFVGSVLFLTVFTTVAAFWPSLRASRLRPVDALRHSD